MAKDERGYLIVPHEVATGADCEGCLIVQKRRELADLVCNVCDAVVDTVPIGRAGARLMELATTEICSAGCPHCGALNTFPGFSPIEAFICSECGEGVKRRGSNPVSPANQSARVIACACLLMLAGNAWAQSFRPDEMVQAHNSVRSRLNLPPLMWSDKLARWRSNGPTPFSPVNSLFIARNRHMAKTCSRSLVRTRRPRRS
jgi:hypothetical protein